MSGLIYIFTEHSISSPLLFPKNVAVKLWEKDVTVKVGHDVSEINEIAPRMLKTFLKNKINSV